MTQQKLRYLHTDVELYEFLIELQEELVQKNQRKKELEEIGCFGAEQYSKIAEIEGVVSHSVGEDPYRKVVVAVSGGQNRRNRKNGGKKPYREKRPEDFKPSSLDNMKTSFEKDYKKPRPEDEFTTGLYGKIEL